MYVFIDSSAFKAFYDEEDVFHPKAEEFMEKVLERKVSVKGFVTTDYILDETITLIKFAHSHRKAVEFGEAALKSRVLKVIYVGERLFEEALDLFRRSEDKEWSFTDCVSFAIMNELGLEKAFTFDRHFSQAGFTILP